MKQIILFTVLLLGSMSLLAQGESKWPDIDKSALDVAYFPQGAAWTNYMEGEAAEVEPKIKVVFSRPKVNGRDIFGTLVPYGKEWRLGANEATLITFYQPVRIGESSLGAGTYSAFAEVNESNWTFHLSSETNIWGNANRDMDKTVASITVPSEKMSYDREEMAITFQEIDDMETHMIVEWENTRAKMPINYNPVTFRPMDVSPLDMAHYPANSAYTNYLDGDEKNIKPKVQVTYSRPAKKGRDIFGELLKDTKVWRVGANEATEIVFYQDVMIGDTKVQRGRYAMFAELNGDTWGIIFSKDFPIWGAANRDESKDVAKAKGMVSMDDEVVEHLSIIFEEKSDDLVHMMIAWDKTRCEVPISFK